MERLEDFLNKNELKTRERWLFWVIKLPAFIFAFIGIVLLGIAMASGIHSKSHDFLLQFFSLIGAGGFAVLFTFYIPYYCAYQKHGTIYLTLSIIGTGISLVYNYLSTALSLGGPPPGYLVIYLLINSALSIVWLYFSWSLLLINRKIQLHLLENKDHYKNAMAAFESAPNPEECKLALYRLTNGVDSPKVRMEIGTAYKNFLKRYQ